MSECWLKPNWRPIAVAMTAPAVMLAASVAGALMSTSSIVRWTCVASAAMAALMLAGLSILLKPRLERDGEWLLVRLNFGPPQRVPLDKVEIFFFGQGPAMAAPNAEQVDEDLQDQTGNVVVRLAESETQLHRRNVEKRLGRWCDGYIIIRGTHCEPLDKEVMGRLNRRLVECHRELRAAKEMSIDPA